MSDLTTLAILWTLSYGPPSGSLYSKTIHFPVVGMQSISLKIFSPKKAEIAMQGIIDHRESLEYAIIENNRVYFNLSNELLNILQKYSCSIHDAWYDEITDEACVVLQINLIRLNRNIRMKREHTSFLQRASDRIKHLKIF